MKGEKMDIDNKALRVAPHEIPVIAVAVALEEAVKRGMLTTDSQLWIENRADELMGWLYSGTVIEVNENGFYKASDMTQDEAEAKFGPGNDILTIGGDDE